MSKRSDFRIVEDTAVERPVCPPWCVTEHRADETANTRHAWHRGEGVDIPGIGEVYVMAPTADRDGNDVPPEVFINCGERLRPSEARELGDALRQVLHLAADSAEAGNLKLRVSPDEARRIGDSTRDTLRALAAVADQCDT